MRKILGLTLMLALFGGSISGGIAGDFPQIAIKGERTAITLWWVVFNNPEHCASAPNPEGTLCNVDDLFNPDVQGAVLYASGTVTNSAGAFELVSSLYESKGGLASTDDVDPFGLGTGLIDSMKAEVHLVVRSHGPAIPELLDEQISAFVEPGCQEMGGPNVCEDLQFSIHAPWADSNVDVYSFADLAPMAGTSARLTRTEDAIKLILRSYIAD